MPSSGHNIFLSVGTMIGDFFHRIRYVDNPELFQANKDFLENIADLFYLEFQYDEATHLLFCQAARTRHEEPLNFQNITDREPAQIRAQSALLDGTGQKTFIDEIKEVPLWEGQVTGTVYIENKPVSRQNAGIKNLSKRLNKAIQDIKFFRDNGIQILVEAKYDFSSEDRHRSFTATAQQAITRHGEKLVEDINYLEVDSQMSYVTFSAIKGRDKHLIHTQQFII